jgi:hypothetical protein
MSKRKIEYAIYQDKDGEWQKIYPDELHDEEILELARNNELFDPSGEHIVFARYRRDAPHFYSMSAIKQVEDFENDTIHNNHLQSILDVLRSRSDYILGTYNFNEPKLKNGKYAFEVIAKIEDYTWDKEVTRGCTWLSVCRHDVFGRCSMLRQSLKYPCIAVEVIHHHYPSQSSFLGWLELSKIVPMVICFDFVYCDDYFFQIRENRIRVTYYIYDGSFWINSKRTSIKLSSEFQNIVIDKISKKFK